MIATFGNYIAGLSISEDMIAYTSTPPEVLYGYISGQTMESKVLTCNYSFIDVDGTSQGSTTFQWVRADDANGTNKTNIGGATSSTYTVTSSDINKYIACEITPVNTTPESGSVFRTAYVGAVDAIFYPIDSFSNVACAFALKKLAAAYAGNGIQIQSTNGGPTQNIGFVANGDLDWAAVQTFAAGGNTFLKIWYDQSGNNNHINFTAFADQPRVNYTDRRIEWQSETQDGFITHASSMNIGTGEFTFFIEATSVQYTDPGFSYFDKKTNFSTNNFQLQNSGGGQTMMTGNGGTNTLAIAAQSDSRRLIAGYRNATTKFARVDDVTVSAAEVATDLTSTVNMLLNAGSGGGGTWHQWSFMVIKQNYGSDYTKVKKFLL